MRVLVGIFALSLSLAASAQSGAGDITPGNRWHEAYATLLDVDFGDSGFHARWQYFYCACGDLLIRVEQTSPDGVETGELLLLNRRLLLARGAIAAQADELSGLLQAPALMVQLAFGLLQRAVPEGPAGITRALPLAMLERDADLQVETGMFSGTFDAPWQLEGKAWPSGPSRRRFELVFSFKNPLPEAPVGMSKITFTGGQDYGRDDFPLNDATPMAGWKLQWLNQEDGEVLEPEEGATLGGMREEAKQAEGQRRDS